MVVMGDASVATFVYISYHIKHDQSSYETKMSDFFQNRSGKGVGCGSW